MTDRAMEFVRHIEGIPALVGFDVVPVQAGDRDVLVVQIRGDEELFMTVEVSGRELAQSRDLWALARIKVDAAINALPIARKARSID